MRTRSAFALTIVLLFSLPGFSQTRARRVGQPPSPSVGPQNPSSRRPNSQPSVSSDKAQVGEEVGDDEVVRVNTTLISIPVSVSDRNGRFIYDLSKDDFQLFDNGVEQQVAYFTSTEKPFTVVVMIDTSTSIWEKLEEIKMAASDFLDQLRPDDQVMVASFANRMTVLCQPTSDRRTLRNAIQNVERGSSTHLYDAMDRVMNNELTRLKGRKAVVLFTDGVDATSSRSDYESNIRDAEELDGLIYPIRYDTYSDMNDPSGYPGNYPSSRYPRGRRSSGGILGSILGGIVIGGGSGGRNGGGWPGGGGGWPGGGSSGGNGSSRADYDRGKNYLYDLAAKTGGRVYEANENRSSMDAAFRSIAEELRHQYSIGYYPNVQAKAGEQRRVKVRVKRPDLAVRSRDSYIYTPTGPGQGSPTATTDNQRPQAPPVLRHPLAGVVYP
jgi:VWFA-related protein